MTKSLSTTPKGAITRAMLDEIEEETKAHRLRAVNFRYERRLHDIESRYLEDQCQARADYMREIVEIPGEDSDACDPRLTQRPGISKGLPSLITGTGYGLIVGAAIT